MQDLANFTPFSDVWNEEDKNLFEKALELHGKEYDVFQRIRQMLPVKSMTDPVEFYYRHYYDYSRDQEKKGRLRRGHT